MKSHALKLLVVTLLIGSLSACSKSAAPKPSGPATPPLPDKQVVPPPPPPPRTSPTPTVSPSPATKPTVTPTPSPVSAELKDRYGKWFNFQILDAQSKVLKTCQGKDMAMPQVRVQAFSKNSKFKIEKLDTPVKNISPIEAAKAIHPNALYLGNGPIFDDEGPKGYMKSDGKVLDMVTTGLNCSPGTSGNWGDENSVFVSYRALDAQGRLNDQSDLIYKVVPYEYLCKQFGIAAYVDAWKKRHPGKSDDDFEKENKILTDDLLNANQIDFAIQSGPGSLRGGVSHSSGSGSVYQDRRSYLGVTVDGLPVTVDVDGPTTLKCVAEMMRDEFGIRDLLFRDANGTGVAFHENGTWTGWPSPGDRMSIESVLIVE